MASWVRGVAEKNIKIAQSSAQNKDRTRRKASFCLSYGWLFLARVSLLVCDLRKSSDSILSVYGIWTKQLCFVPNISWDKGWNNTNNKNKCSLSALRYSWWQCIARAGKLCRIGGKSAFIFCRTLSIVSVSGFLKLAKYGSENKAIFSKHNNQPAFTKYFLSKGSVWWNFEPLR